MNVNEPRINETRKMNPSVKSTQKKKSQKDYNLKPYLLVTLDHAERRESLTREEIVWRIQSLFLCRCIIIARENHKEAEGYHYHIGVLNESARKNTLTREVRRTFPEWDQYACNVKWHRAWASVCGYALKEDQHPLVVG